MKFVIEPPALPAVPVAREHALFPVRRIFCVGRNYAEHAREMGATGREAPFFFTKPADAIVPEGGDVPYPPATAELHHEVELVVALQTGGADIAAADAPGCIFGYAVGIDLTRRDLQAEAKEKGRPWDMAKGFDASAPLSALKPASETGHLQSGAITLDVNGETRQRGDLADMIWSVPEIVVALSRLVTLAPGDLIFTGTPAGVGAAARGDRLHAEIAGLAALDIRLV